MNAQQDRNKGFSILEQALHELYNVNDIEKNEVEIILYGIKEFKQGKILFKINNQGVIKDEIKMASIYNAADVTVVPSLSENFSNTILESLACDAPVVAFNIGGNPDLIDHLQTGYLANLKDAHDLTNGLKWILKNGNVPKAHKKIQDNRGLKIIASRYNELYENITK
jgi:glycosyltransferase involved in cell wall biosynthesis